MITVEAFEKVDVRAGTVIDVKPNKKSRNPAYVVSIDFGEELGVKKSSAQITALYQPEDLVGKQVICCVNLAPMHIGSVIPKVDPNWISLRASHACERSGFIPLLSLCGDFEKKVSIAKQAKMNGEARTCLLSADFRKLSSA